MAVTGIDAQSKAAADYVKNNRREDAGAAAFKDMLLTTMGKDPNKKAPYSHLAKDGVIEYNGVTFVCDYKHNALCLGDVSNPKNVIYVALADGGTLQVNRDNVDDLSKAIGMFSPEDVNRILRAISLDAQCQRRLMEIDEERNSIGKAEEE
ncbi:MAG: hypothetical protein HDQ99_07845 [Lachnospiraceae bacterium]|nr:hypothetical protein [Lachnospiraceae bacterium]